MYIDNIYIYIICKAGFCSSAILGSRKDTSLSQKITMYKIFNKFLVVFNALTQIYPVQKYIHNI